MTRRNYIRRAAKPAGTPAAGRSGSLLAALFVVVSVALTAAGGATAEPASIAGKRAEAARVLAQVDQLDSEVAHATEAYNLANVRLDQIKADQRHNRFLLGHARTNFRRANVQLEQRLVALYTGETSASTIEVVLGAKTLEDVLNGLETAERVSRQDTEVVAQVQRFRKEVERRKARLAEARARQAELVEQRAAKRRQIEARLAERQRLLSTIRTEIARLEAEERARQERLRREAEARLAAQRRAAAAAPSRPAPAAAAPAAATAEGDPAGTAAPPPARHGGVVGIAMQYLGVPYKWGGASPSTGFDCSGLVMYVFGQVGVSLPHSTYALWGMGSAVSRGALQPGDLVFFNGLGHMGIYIGGGSFIHAPRTGDVVKISPMSGWYASSYVGARRIG